MNDLYSECLNLVKIKLLLIQLCKVTWHGKTLKIHCQEQRIKKKIFHLFPFVFYYFMFSRGHNINLNSTTTQDDQKSISDFEGNILLLIR